MHSLIRAYPVSLLVAALLLLAGCTREEGESCQDNRDCDEGLICYPKNEERGTCIKPEDIEVDAAVPDAGNPPIREEGGVDSGPEDAGDAGGTDAGDAGGGGDDASAGGDDAGG